MKSECNHACVLTSTIWSIPSCPYLFQCKKCWERFYDVQSFDLLFLSVHSDSRPRDQEEKQKDNRELQKYGDDFF